MTWNNNNWFTDNWSRSYGAKKLAEVLMVNTSLTELNISGDMWKKKKKKRISWNWLNE